MFERYPINILIEEGCRKLDVRRSELVVRCGFKNVSKGLRRLDTLCDGATESKSAEMILSALPAALKVEASEVERAVKETIDIVTHERAEVEAKREAAWRASFQPNAYLVGTDNRPSSIAIYCLSGGAERWLKIPLDLSQPPITFVRQALSVVRRTSTVPFFGVATGLIINYTPDRAVRFDIDGAPVEAFDRAYIPGSVDVFVGSQRLPREAFLGAN